MGTDGSEFINMMGLRDETSVHGAMVLSVRPVVFQHDGIHEMS